MSSPPPWILLNPGPINVSDEVRGALLRPDLCHREPEFQSLLAAVRRKLIEVFGVAESHVAGVLAGSGTAAVEAMVNAALPGGGKLLVIENGVYGERMSEMARRAGIALEILHFEWTEGIDVAALDRALAADKEIRAVAAVHHETTTGRLNPAREIGQVVAEHGRTYLLDSVSGLAAEHIDLAGAHVDLVACTANKAIHGVPGVSFCLITREHLERLAEHRPASLYLDLGHAIRINEQGSIPFTMPVHVLYALDAALDQLAAETVAGRCARFAGRAAKVRGCLAELRIERLLPDDALSNSLTTWYLPEGLSYDELHDRLKELGFVIYAGQGPLGGKAFRIAHMGEYPPETTDRLLDALRSVLGPS